MNISSTFEDDIRSKKTTPGAYEWWYFDATSDDGSVEIVIIFYDGNPFSRRYIQHQQNGAAAHADEFPAISISVYKDHKPIYYSFTEVDKAQASFGDDTPDIRIGKHRLKGAKSEGQIIYTIHLKEELPSGDAIVGQLQFESAPVPEKLLGNSDSDTQNHQWNLVQPQARVTGRLSCYARNESPLRLNFKGRGYHDHNMGNEPLKHQFNDWYWGRFHFEQTTLVYYIMQNEQQHQLGWLISNDNKEVISTFNDVRLEDTGYSLYGLSTARKIILSNQEAQVMVQQARILDNGPFYQRFSSDAFLNIPGRDTVLSSRGLTEYLNPPRIYKRLFWPLTNMRIRYQKESPHWVQRSKMLYRWTW